LLGAAEEQRDETEYATVTDAEGRFRFEEVKPGTYRVYFGRNGFVETDNRHHGEGMVVSLDPAQDVKDLLFHMAPAAVITGRVRDDDGDPIRGASVIAIPYGSAPGGRRGRTLDNYAQCSTNDLGECRISYLASGRYFVATKPEFHVPPLTRKRTDKREQVDTTTYYPGTTDEKLAVPLELHAGDEMPVDVTMQSVHTFHVRGQVVNLPEWTDKEGAELMLQPQDEGEEEIYLPAGNLDKHGAFDIKGVVPGTYDVVMSPSKAYSMIEAFGMVGDPQAPHVMRADQTVEVSDGDVDNLRIVPLVNGQIRGRLHMENGQKMDWSSVYVELDAENARPSGMAVTGNAAAEVKREGSFGTLALPGKYHLRFIHSGKLPPDYFMKTVSLGDKDVVDSGFTVSGGAYSLDVVVSAAAAAVEGVALDDKGKPASDVQVIFIPDTKRRERRDLYQQIMTDHLGHFALRGLNPGEYQVFALDADVERDEITDPEFVRAHESSGQTIKIAEGEHKSIVVKLTRSGD
jgi:hypothetical protein